MFRRTPTGDPIPTEDPRPAPPADDDGRGGGAIRETAITIGAALLLAWLVQGFLVKPFKIPSASMKNTLQCRDRVLVNRLSYRFGDPHRGDVVVFHPPAGVDPQGRTTPEVVASDGGAEMQKGERRGKVTESSRAYVKRVIGLPGDKIEVRDHHAYVNGKRRKEPYLHPLPDGGGASPLRDFGPVKVRKGMYFMMGDNRDNSLDSRWFGQVPRDFIVGRSFWIYWPPKHLGGLPTRDSSKSGASDIDAGCEEGLPQG